MTDRFKVSLSGMWLIVSFFSLALPIFLPSYSNSPTNTIGAATATMFILSFPSSIFGIPVIYAVDFVLGLDPQSLEGMYVNLLLLFFLGLVQWFWIVPRIWRNDPTFQRLELRQSPEPGGLSEAPSEIRMESFRSQDTTPLERVIRDESD